MAHNQVKNESAHNRAIACFRNGDFVGAANVLTQLIAEQPSAALYFQRGAAHYNADNGISAEQDFTEAMRRGDKTLNCRLFRARARLRLQKLDEAVEDFSSAIEIDPTSTEAAWARGRILAGRGQWQQAKRDFSRVIAIEPENQQAYAARGEMHQRLQDWPRCVADYRRATELSSNDAKTLNRLAWVLATCPIESLRNGTDAVQLAEQANLEADNRDHLILDTLAAAHAECGNFARARELITQAMLIAPTNSELQQHANAFAAQQPWRDTIS